MRTSLIIISIIAIVLVMAFFLRNHPAPLKAIDATVITSDDNWHAPSIAEQESLPEEQKKWIRLGADIIAHTARYYGPRGSIAQQSNGMNCQNCHLDAGTRPFGNNYSAVFATYPKFRARSGSMESIFKRVNDCFMRSLGGKPIDSNSTSFKAIYAYMQWLGKNVPKGKSPAGSGIKKITFIDRPADTLKGRMVFESNCVTCHRENGQGVLNADSTEYVYPPLWGDHSYTMGAGLFRVSTFAGYAYCNMPFGKASAAAPVLTNEQAWDVAAYINAKPRPSYDVKKDWPVLSTKPVDYPFGPYADTFTEQQHKFGPFAPIAAWQDSVKKITATAKAKL